MATGVPLEVPAGALVIFSDGRVDSVPSGSTAIPTDGTAPAGFTTITAELIQSDGVAANTPVAIALEHAPLVPASLVISTLDPLVITEDGTGALTGDTGSGATNTIDLDNGEGECSFNATAAGPIVADYQWLGVSTGTVFTLVGPTGIPLGMGTITLSNGTPLQGTTISAGTEAIRYDAVSFVVDADPSAPSLQLSDENLDQATLELIGAQLRECSGLIQTEATMSLQGMPWLRRGVVLEMTDLHHEGGGAFVTPRFLIAERTHRQAAGGPSGGTQRNVKGLAWAVPGLKIPPGAALEASGDAATFNRTGPWQPNTQYDALDVIVPGAQSHGIHFVAVRLWDDGTIWTLPALSGTRNPFQSLLDGQIRSIDLEGAWIIDRDLNGWWGFHQVVTLTGTVAGESLRARDRSGVVHYVTYFPDVDVWTDTPEPPGM